MEFIAGVLLAGALGWAILAYNRLVRDRHRVDAGWSDIDVQLKRRHDLIPQLVAAVRQYAAYEQATLSAVVALRTQAVNGDGVATRATAEHALGGGVYRLIALAEAYPALKADAGFLDLQHQVSAVEKDIQHARRYYNGAVRNLNTRIDTFPDLLIAGLLRYRPREYFEYDPAV